ncbi:sensor histidine kinase [Nesterenkonia populi]|uniref:sensor histidine kinase n=1 Tax=Nesterenkonia populi TaxID=1591087 RepID=UPI0011BF6BD7|nr:histidine kinase [Nesterenkonia populi]
MPESERPPPSPTSGFEELALVRRPGIRGWFRRHPRCMNAAVVGIYLFISLWTLPTAALDMGQSAWWLLPGHLLIAALLCFRHRWPLLVLLAAGLTEAAMLAFYPWNGTQMLSVWFAAYCIGLHRGLIWAVGTGVPVTVFGYASYVRLDAWTAEHGPSFWLTDVYMAPTENVMGLGAVIVVVQLFSTGIAGAIGSAVRTSRRHEQEMLEWASRSHELAQAAERNRIAREMHDVVAHSLSVMISLADGAKVVSRRDPGRAEEVLTELSSTGRTALADMRRVIGVLKKGEDVGEARRPMRESLEELYEGFRQAGLPLRVRTSGPPLPEDAAFGLTVHRIIQESLTNVLRYGRQVTDVEAAVEHLPGTTEEEWQRLAEDGYSQKEAEALGLAGPAQVIISITDDGIVADADGPRSSVGSGLGIRGMQERAGFYNGSVWAGPGKYRGWTVRAVLEPPQRRRDA